MTTSITQTIFSQEQLEQLLATDSITERDALVKELEIRIDYIIRQVIFKHCKTKGWWAWSYYENGDVEPTFSKNLILQKDNLLDIYFSLEKSLEYDGYIYNGGEWGLDCFGSQGFPLDWLWTENIEDVFVKGWQEYKNKEKEKKEARKLHKAEIAEKKKKFRASAMQKLAPEEKWACGLSKKTPKTI